MPPDANELIHKLLRSSEEGKIDYKSDWKLTTILIGGNDMCDYCKDRVSCGVCFGMWLRYIFWYLKIQLLIVRAQREHREQ